MAKHHAGGERHSPTAAATGKHGSAMRKKRDFFANSPKGSRPSKSTKSPASSPSSVSISTASLTASQPSTPPLGGFAITNAKAKPSNTTVIETSAAVTTVSSIFNSAQSTLTATTSHWPSGVANGYNPTLAQSGITSGQRSTTLRPHKQNSSTKHSGINKKHQTERHQVSPNSIFSNNATSTASGSPERAAKMSMVPTEITDVSHHSVSDTSGEVSIFSVAKQVGALNQIRVRRAVPLSASTAPTSPEAATTVAQLSNDNFSNAAECNSQQPSKKKSTVQTSDVVKSVEQSDNKSTGEEAVHDRQQHVQQQAPADKLMQQNFYGYYVDYLLKHAAQASSASSTLMAEQASSQNQSVPQSNSTPSTVQNASDSTKPATSAGPQQNSELRARLTSSFNCNNNNHRNLYNLPTRDGDNRPPTMPRMPLFARSDFRPQKLQHNFAPACSSDDVGSKGGSSGMITYGSILEQALRNGLKSSPASDCDGNGVKINGQGLDGNDSSGLPSAETGSNVNRDACGNEATPSRSPTSAFDNKNYYQAKASPPSANGSSTDLCTRSLKVDVAREAQQPPANTTNSLQASDSNCCDKSVAISSMMMRKSQSSAEFYEHRAGGAAGRQNLHDESSFDPNKRSSNTRRRSGSLSQPPLGTLTSDDEGLVSVQSVVQNVQLASMRSIAHLRAFTESSTSPTSSASLVMPTCDLVSSESALAHQQQLRQARKKRQRNADSVRLDESREKLIKRVLSGDRSHQRRSFVSSEAVDTTSSARFSSVSVLPSAALSAPPPAMPSPISFDAATDCAAASKNSVLNSTAITHWNEAQVVEWLRSLSLLDESAIKAMEEEKLDGSALCLLTEQHLTNHFGLKLGPTLKLRSAIYKQQQQGSVSDDVEKRHYQPPAWFVPSNTPHIGDTDITFETALAAHLHDLSASAATSLAPAPPINNFISPASHINATSADDKCSTDRNGMLSQHSLVNYNSNCSAVDNPFGLSSAVLNSQMASSLMIPSEFNFPFADPASAVSAFQQQLLGCSPLQQLYAAAAAAAAAAASSSNGINSPAVPLSGKFLSSNTLEMPMPPTLSTMLPEHSTNQTATSSSRSYTSAVFKGFNSLNNSFAGNFGPGGIAHHDGDHVSSKTIPS